MHIKATNRTIIKLLAHRINERIQFMKDHALIGNFRGFWPTIKSLRRWISSKLNPKGHIDLQLCAKGLFNVIFTYIEDKNWIMYGGPYFFNSVGLYRHNWVEHLNTYKQYLTWSLVWIRLYTLNQDYWDELTLWDIYNALGEFIKTAKETKINPHATYTRICVYMNIAESLPGKVSLLHDDYEWIQTVDYEHVPFRF